MDELIVQGSEGLDYEAAVDVPLIPHSTTDALTPEQAFQVAASLRGQASAYETAARLALARVQVFQGIGYKCRPAVRQYEKPYNRIWRHLNVEVRGVPEKWSA